LELPLTGPYGYYDAPPYDCAPYGYYGQNGLRVVSSLELAPGFMARQTSTGTSTIISILNMATTAQDHTPATDPKRASLSVRLPTSKENEVRDGRGHVGKR